MRAHLFEQDDRAVQTAERLLYAAGRFNSTAISNLDERRPRWRSTPLTPAEIEHASSSDDPTLVWAAQIWREHGTSIENQTP